MLLSLSMDARYASQLAEPMNLSMKPTLANIYKHKRARGPNWASILRAYGVKSKKCVPAEGVDDCLPRHMSSKICSLRARITSHCLLQL